ncbi:hypothetical protein F2P81_016785 [Scophthalmus maximus]|uniref:Uncharacterized protein n=1 Tax=Scophthalmus maximus TaxID=52904 RepID=A0A6A4SGJ3_SCOMX|nr:hypothetical protein F2P81_016785 [Scophthalmus maximus]
MKSSNDGERPSDIVGLQPVSLWNGCWPRYNLRHHLLTHKKAASGGNDGNKQHERGVEHGGGEKHIDSPPELASFGERWSVAKMLSSLALRLGQQKKVSGIGENGRESAAVNDTTTISALNGF